MENKDFEKKSKTGDLHKPVQAFKPVIRSTGHQSKTSSDSKNKTSSFQGVSDTPVPASTFEISKDIQEDSKKLFSEAMLNYTKKNDLDKCIELLQRVIDLDSEYTDAFYNLGVCYSHKGNFESAVSMFKSVLLLDTNPKSDVHESARFNLANQYIALQKYSDAIEQYEKILEKNSRAADVIYNLAYVYFKYLIDYDKAIYYFDYLLKINSVHQDSRYNLALCYQFRGQTEKAIHHFETLMRINPEFVPVYYNLALIYKEQGKKDKALWFFEKYLSAPQKSKDQYSYVKYASRRVKELYKEMGVSNEVNFEQFFTGTDQTI